MFENIKVVKRDGKKVDFDGSKIALAIKQSCHQNLKHNDQPLLQ